jgi:hypothetical protein
MVSFQNEARRQLMTDETTILELRGWHSQNFVCSICGEDSEGFGNKAWPVNDGRCCDYCNWTRVLVARLERLRDPLKMR